MKKLFSMAICTAFLVILLGGCAAFYYSLDFNGQEDFYLKTKEFYKGGSKVTLCYNMVVDDADTSFYLNGEEINAEYNYKKGYIIKFTMPEKDSNILCVETPSMVSE